MGLGILSGLLGAMGATPDAEGGLGILGRLGQGIHDNSGMLMGFAGGGMEGALQGKRSDMLAAAQRQEQEDKAKKIQAAQMMAQELKLPPEIAQNPEAVQALYTHVKSAQMTPKTPQLVGSAETGYTWAIPGQKLPDAFTTPRGPKPTDDIREFLYSEKNPAFKDYLTNVKKPPGTVINNAVNPIVKGIADNISASTDTANAAAGEIGTIHEARRQIEDGIIAGQGADQKLTLAKVGQAFGIDDPRIANTETFRSTVGGRVLSAVKQLGAGSGISNADREFAEKMVGGSISLDQNSLSRLLDIGERASRAKIQMHNARVDRYIKTQPDLAQYGEFLKIPEPGGYAGTNPAIKSAREAIRQGANPEAVKKRLQDAGIDPTGL